MRFRWSALERVGASTSVSESVCDELDMIAVAAITFAARGFPFAGKCNHSFFFPLALV